MNDSTFQREPLADAAGDETPPRDDEPQFGVVDIVEAFTAMRHEWRGQVRESRALGEQVEAAVANLRSLESKLVARTAENGDESSIARQLVQLIVETDYQLTRAVTAIVQREKNRRQVEEASAKAVERYFAAMNGLTRWFARPLFQFMAEQRPVRGSANEDPAVEGLNLVLARLRRMMSERIIERLDVEGAEFDAGTMRAIGTVESAECPSGHVVEQLSPAYRWQGQVLRFAEVWLAK